MQHMFEGIHKRTVRKNKGKNTMKKILFATTNEGKMREIRMIMEGSGYEITSLKDAGIKVMETGFYETEAPACGCGAKLDHRDFGPNGKIDRLTYYISVKPEDVERAKELLADLVKPEHVAPQ